MGLKPRQQRQPVRNEYLEKFREVFGETHQDYWTALQKSLERGADDTIKQWRCREVWTRMYAWAIPDQPALELCAAHGPIVEIGAGTGYWAKLLREMGVDVVAYDQAPPRADGETNVYHLHTPQHSEVLDGGPEKAAEHSDRALMLCWPPYNDSMASDCLARYEGSTLIYVGEGDGGCTGDGRFHETLREEWEEVTYLHLPTYPGIHDYIAVYRRR
jgi:hypothetical protein